MLQTKHSLEETTGNASHCAMFHEPTDCDSYKQNVKMNRQF